MKLIDEIRRVGRVVMQRIANPSISVRFRDAPPFYILQCPGGGIGRHKGLKILQLLAIRVQISSRVGF